MTKEQMIITANNKQIGLLKRKRNRLRTREEMVTRQIKILTRQNADLRRMMDENIQTD